MALLVGFIAQAWNTTGQATLSFAALTAPGGGTVAAASGQMALVEAEHSSASSPMPSGWAHAGDSLWWKLLTPSDISAGSVTVKGRLTSLTVASGAVSIGRTTSQPQVRVRSASGAALYRIVWTSAWDSSPSTAPATYRLGAETVSPDDGHHHAVYFRAASSSGYLSLPGASDDPSWVAYELVPPSAPLQPVLLSPTSGTAVNRAAPVTLAWAPQSASGLPQTACKVVIRVAGGTWGSLKADGTIAAGDTSTELAQSASSATIAAGVLTNGAQYEWLVYTKDSAGWSPASATWTLTARTLPTATVTLTTAAGDLSPSVTGTIAAGTGTPQGAQVRICAAADAAPGAPVWDSGVRPGTSTSVALDVPASTPWVNGASYRAWLRPTDSALTGAWVSSSAATVSWTPPAAPSSVAVSDGSPPTVTVSGVPVGSALVTIEVASVGVEDWAALSSMTGPGATVSLGLPLAPYGVARRYRAQAWAYVDGVLVSSSYVTSAALTSTDGASYVVAADGTGFVMVELHEAGALQPIQGYSSTSGLGDIAARVDRTPVGGYRSWWDAETDTPTDEATLVGWLTDPDRPTLWLKPSPERPFVGGPAALPALLVAVESVPKVERWAQAALSPRRVRFEWVTQPEDD